MVKFLTGFMALCMVISVTTLKGQCTNADFETGNFTGWTATWDLHGGTVGGCTSYPLPFLDTGFNQGPLNTGPVSQTYNQFIMDSGYDANLPHVQLPNVWPGSGAYSAIVGNTKGLGDAESVSYTFTVTPASTNFTYHYAPVIYEGTPGTHTEGQQPYFRVQMVAGATDTIACASFQVDGFTAPSIGGFVQTTDFYSNSMVYFKPWSTVLVPLSNYIGQTVAITFIAASCSPNGCSGPHYAYAHLDAECAPLQLTVESPLVCLGDTGVLTAPDGAQTYTWSGQGIIGSDTSRTIKFNQPGNYTCVLTTFGQTPCFIALDTVISAIAVTPVADFMATSTCTGGQLSLLNLSSPAGGITGQMWTFAGFTPDTSTQSNPVVFADSAGIYSINLQVTSNCGVSDTSISVVVYATPTSTFTATDTVLVGQNSIVTYTGAADSTSFFNWNFDGGSIDSSASVTLQKSVNWADTGTYTLTLIVSQNGCTSVSDTQVVVVKNFPTGLIPTGTGMNDLYLFPNPTNGILNIQLTVNTGYTFKLYDVLGNLIQTIAGVATAGELIPVDLSRNSEGIYLVQIVTPALNRTGKITLLK